MEKEKSKNLSLKTYLITPINFTDNDLETNRNGGLSKTQQLELEQRQRFWKRWVGPALVIGFLPVLLSIGLGITGHLLWSKVYFPFILIVSASGVAIAMSIQKKYRAFESDLDTGRVRRVRGQVKLTAYIGNMSKLTINNKVFIFHSLPLFAFKNGDPYCLYYAPHSRTLLSAEWLRED
ncbi:MAG TPA: hypothetical protein VHO69_15875 [Phototrophicaceae bacterium]|nr:hypothetical protein [Phototrophicaceae bacterium]